MAEVLVEEHADKVLMADILIQVLEVPVEVPVVEEYSVEVPMD